MTEFKITIEAAALTEAINNLAAAIGSAGRSAETAPAITSAPKKRTKAPASAPAPGESAAAPTPVNPAVPAAPSPTAPAAGTFVLGAPQANPVTTVPTNAQPFAPSTPCVPGAPGVPGVPTAPAVPAAPVGYTLSQLSNAGATLVAAIPALKKLAACELTPKTLYKVSKLLSKLDKETELFNSTRNQFVRELGREVKNGEWEVKKENEEAFFGKINELLDVDIDEAIEPVTLPNSENFRLSYNDLCLLKGLVELEEPEE